MSRFLLVGERIIYSFLLFGAYSVSAANEPPPGTGGTKIQIPDPLGKDFGAVATAIGDALTTIAVPIVAIMVIWGGFQIMTAAGSEEKVSSGRKTITYAVIGFAVVLFSSKIVPLINEILAGQ